MSRARRMSRKPTAPAAALFRAGTGQPPLPLRQPPAPEPKARKHSLSTGGWFFGGWGPQQAAVCRPCRMSGRFRAGFGPERAAWSVSVSPAPAGRHRAPAAVRRVFREGAPQMRRRLPLSSKQTHHLPSPCLRATESLLRPHKPVRQRQRRRYAPGGDVRRSRPRHPPSRGAAPRRARRARRARAADAPTRRRAASVRPPGARSASRRSNPCFVS